MFRRAKRFLLGLLLTLLLVGAGVIYIAWRLSWEKPTWYSPPNPRDQHVAQLADDTEYSLLENTQKIRAPQEDWTLRLSANQINAWLSTRLPAWIEHDAAMHWPAQLGTPQVLIEPDGLRVALPLGGEGAEHGGPAAAQRTIVATLAPSITADHRLALPLTHVALGRISMPWGGEPLSKLVDAIRQVAPEFLDDERVRSAIDVLAGRQTVPPQFTLSDGRRVVLTSVKLEAGFVQITARTLEHGRTERSGAGSSGRPDR